MIGTLAILATVAYISYTLFQYKKHLHRLPFLHSESLCFYSSQPVLEPVLILPSVFVERSYVFNYVFVVGIFLQLLYVARGIIGHQAYPCYLQALFVFCTLIVAWGPITTRILVFYFKLRRSRLIVTEEYFNKVYHTEKGYGDRIKATEAPGNKKSSVKDIRGSVEEQGSLAIKSVAADGPSRVFRITSSLATTKAGMIFFAVLLLFKVPYFIVDEADLLSCIGCGPEKDNIINNRLIYTAIDIGLVMIAFYVTRREADPLKEKREMSLALFVVFIFSILVGLLEAFDPFNVEENGGFEYSLLLLLGLMISYYILIPLQLKNALAIEAKKEAKKRTNQASYRRDSSLEDILKNDSTCALFKLHLTDEYSFENYMFYQAAMYWKDNFHELSEEKKLGVAQAIEEIYLSSSGDLQVNIYSMTRKAAQEKIKQKEITVDMFDDVFWEVSGLLSRDSLPRFKNSRRYKHWLQNELEAADFDEFNM